MAGRSQSESEQPAKVYQLDAVESKVDQALSKLDIITDGIKGVVTVNQVKEMIKESEQRMEESVSDEIKKVHLKYGPMYKGIWWVIAAVISGLISLLWATINNFWRGQ